MIPETVLSTLGLASAFGLTLAVAGCARRSITLLVMAAFIVVTAAGFAFSAIALS